MRSSWSLTRRQSHSTVTLPAVSLRLVYRRWRGAEWRALRSQRNSRRARRFLDSRNRLTRACSRQAARNVLNRNGDAPARFAAERRALARFFHECCSWTDRIECDALLRRSRVCVRRLRQNPLSPSRKGCCPLTMEAGRSALGRERIPTDDSAQVRHQRSDLRRHHRRHDRSCDLVECRAGRQVRHVNELSHLPALGTGWAPDELSRAPGRLSVCGRDWLVSRVRGTLSHRGG